jgi:hypothetical protein
MLKRTTEEVSKYFANYGYELVGNYEGAVIPIDCKCPSCKRIIKISWNNFSRGRRCPYCQKTGRKKKYTLDEVKELFLKHGCTLLATEYNNNLEPMPCICKCGESWQVCLNSILNQSAHCPKCGREKTKTKVDLTRQQNKQYRKLYYKYRKSLRRTLAALGLGKMDYSHKLLGYTAKELQTHITNHPNYVRVANGEWHLDHIFPVKAFVDHGINDIKLINALDNLQPLSQKENNSKCDKYNENEFKNYLIRKEKIMKMEQWEQFGLLENFNSDKKESIAGCLQAQWTFNESKDDLPTTFRRLSIPLVIRVFSESEAFQRNNFTLPYKQEGEPKTLMFHAKYDESTKIDLDREAKHCADLAKLMKEELDEAFGDSKNMEVEFMGFGCLNNGTLLMYYK